MIHKKVLILEVNHKINNKTVLLTKDLLLTAPEVIHLITIRISVHINKNAPDTTTKETTTAIIKAGIKDRSKTAIDGPRPAISVRSKAGITEDRTTETVKEITIRAGIKDRSKADTTDPKAAINVRSALKAAGRLWAENHPELKTDRQNSCLLIKNSFYRLKNCTKRCCLCLTRMHMKLSVNKSGLRQEKFSLA